MPAPAGGDLQVAGQREAGTGGYACDVSDELQQAGEFGCSQGRPVPLPRAVACVSTDDIDVKNVSIGPMVSRGPASASSTAEAAPEKSSRGSALLSAACRAEALGGGISVSGASHGCALTVS